MLKHTMPTLPEMWLLNTAPAALRAGGAGGAQLNHGTQMGCHSSWSSPALISIDLTLSEARVWPSVFEGASRAGAIQAGWRCSPLPTSQAGVVGRVGSSLPPVGL